MRLRKATESQFLKGEKDSEGRKVRVQNDVWDKTVPFLEGLLHFVTFIDDSSRKVWIYFLKHKSDAFDVFKKLLAQVENDQVGILSA